MGEPGGRVSGSERVKITEDVRKYAAEQAISEEEALKKGMEVKSKEFAEKGSELYAKA
jgi:phosphomethylpyrimidine synthase